MKKLQLKLIPIISIFMLFLFAIASIGFFNFNQNITMAQSNQTNSNFFLNVLDRSGNQLLTDTETTFNGKKAYVYQWKDVSKLVLNFDPAKRIPGKAYNEKMQECYDLTVEVQYVQGFRQEASWTRFNTLTFYTNTQTGEESYLNFANIKPEFVVDQGITGIDQTASNTQVNIGTWGIYRFRSVINGQDTLSDYFIIEPTLEILEAPKIVYETIPSQSTLLNAFNFSLANNETFKYINKENLVWYVLGKSTDGATYALTFSDINSGKDEFSGCSTAFAETYSRTGQTFTFDSMGVQGDWQVWCEYNYDGKVESSIKSNVQKVKTGNKLSVGTIVWIVIGISLLAIGVSIGISLYKVKRERIY